MAIDPFYWLAFAAFALPAAWLEYDHGSGLFGGGKGAADAAVAAAAGGGSVEYARFRNNYLAVFALMMAGDWLQGPYIYHLYEHYGFSVRDIGRLFIMGFASSAVFGTVAGALADKYGRKLGALLYVATYAASCATKHSSAYSVLLAGRLLGGVSTSLLFSVFEAWAVAAHAARGLDETLLADLFTKAVMLGNGVMAIASGLVGSWLVQGLGLGPVAPFDAAILALLAGGLIVALTWEENCGSAAGSGGSLVQQFSAAAGVILRDERVALLGIMQALFEASMYTFVFLWTPALNPHAFLPDAAQTAAGTAPALAASINSGAARHLLAGAGGYNSDSGSSAYHLTLGSRSGGGGGTAGSAFARLPLSAGGMGGGDAQPHLPHGLVFAIFMTASMVGTALAGRLMASWRLEAVLQGVFWAGAALLAVPVLYHTRLADHAVAGDVLQGEVHSWEARAHVAGRGAGGDTVGTQQALQLAAGGGSAAPPAAAVTPRLDVGGRVQLLAFCGFEVLIGLFWPSMMALRARYVPEEQRSTIINIFRIPLNAFVCIILWKVSDFPLGVMFGVCCLFLVAAALAQARLAAITPQGPAKRSSLGGGGGAGGSGTGGNRASNGCPLDTGPGGGAQDGASSNQAHSDRGGGACAGAVLRSVRPGSPARSSLAGVVVTR